MDVKLVMFKPNGLRKDFPVSKELLVIGRGENCDLQIPLEAVSRRHCEVSLSGDEVKVKDLASSNGTYVNNKRVNECALAAGDRLVIGPIVFTLQVDGVPEQIAPIKTAGQREAEAPVDEEIVEDVFSAAEPAPEDIDPIAALEALAAEGQQLDDEK